MGVVSWAWALEALEALDHMETAGLRPSPMTCTSAMGACWAGGLQLLGFWELEGDRLTSCPCEEASTWQVALGLLVEVSTSWSWGKDACQLACGWPKALQVLAGLVSARVRAHQLVFNAAVSACKPASLWQNSFFLLGQVRGVQVRTQLASSSAVISACETASEWEQAAVVFNELKARECELSVITNDTVISAHEQLGIAVLYI